MKHTKTSIFFLIFLNFAVFGFAQRFSRVIELKSPPMYGEDIKQLQAYLVDCGFVEIGEIDGYYGPLTANVIKTIQKFWPSFYVTGNVDSRLWASIFNSDNREMIKNMSIVSKYDKSTMEKETERRDGYTSRGGYLDKYSQDGQVKLIEMVLYARLYEERYSIFFISPTYYFFVKEGYTYHFPENDAEMAGYKGLYDYLYSEENRVISERIDSSYLITGERDPEKYGPSIYTMQIINGLEPKYKFETTTIEFKL